ncbi:cell adhesion molecule 2-like [Uloborus diversus]|uniref:cell adhesion molecule 2-like n=1 Tax=Uloborus diversus TaxID=327109 RepID=UPI002408F8B8|nr:cell adhesion molecule 2-like [Uloborus diversus]XP_054715708.1 cell adhesion molecule 2-like [Uloborus diversus]
MIRDPPFTAYIVEHLLFLFVTSVPIISSRSHIPLRINMLHIPTPVVTGDSVRLRCGYELGNETLYAVKWYKNMGEFFRYVPASDPPLKAFPQVGIDVDISRSDNSTVYLRNLSLESFGNYTCQVSTDKPFFRCVQTTRPLEVVVPPSDGPVLMEEKSDYELGDNVSILCNSGKSKPAPDLKWYINDQLAPSSLSDRETVVYPDQLESSSLALRFRLRPDVIHDGKVVLKCVASINHIRAVTIKEIRAHGVKQAESYIWLLWAAAIMVLYFQASQTKHPL